jgi:hypothetical protein
VERGSGAEQPTFYPALEMRPVTRHDLCRGGE